jgi:hypothetical protein
MMRTISWTRRRFCGVLISLSAGGIAGGAISKTPCLADGAVSARPTAEPSLLRQLIPEPTGNNGAEEFLMAADLVHQSPALAPAVASGATLAQKRVCLADRDCARAMDLLRRGLRKPVQSPRAAIGVDTRYPEAGSFRQLGQLLEVEQYVLLADGRTPAAIDSLRDGMNFARAIQVAMPASVGFHGRKLTQSLLGAFAHHLDQLSAADCDHLVKVCREWLAPPAPAAALLEVERQMDQEALARVRVKPDLLLQWWPNEVVGAGEPEAEIAATAQRDPAAFHAIIASAGEKVDRHFKHAIEQLGRPAWQRESTSLPPDHSPAGRLAGCLCYADNTDRFLDFFTEEQSLGRLLGCHAAIRRYRWEHDRLPTSLAEAGPGELAIDPFTGQPLRYTVRGREYDLSSAGRRDRDHRPDAVDGRVPVALASG